MADDFDDVILSVRADRQQFQRDIAGLRKDLEEPLVAGANRAANLIDQALGKAVRSGKFGFEDLRRVALGALDDIARKAISNGFTSLFGGGGAGEAGTGPRNAGSVGGGLATLAQSLVLSLVGVPGRATGGLVSPGRAYRVGEQGPEYFVPTSSGRIEPTAASPQTARAVTINIAIHGAGDGAQSPQRLAQSSRQIAAAVRRAVLTAEE